MAALPAAIGIAQDESANRHQAHEGWVQTAVLGAAEAHQPRRPTAIPVRDQQPRDRPLRPCHRQKGAESRGAAEHLNSGFSGKESSTARTRITPNNEQSEIGGSTRVDGTVHVQGFGQSDGSLTWAVRMQVIGVHFPSTRQNPKSIGEVHDNWRELRRGRYRRKWSKARRQQRLRRAVVEQDAPRPGHEPAKSTASACRSGRTLEYLAPCPAPFTGQGLPAIR
jgi:hypothetical protein